MKCMQFGSGLVHSRDDLVKIFLISTFGMGIRGLMTLTDKIKCLLKILFNILMWRITSWYLFVFKLGP